MKRSLLSLLVIGVVAAAALGLSRSFFSDTETSSGNTFEAGAIDLLIDNVSYLNGSLNDGTTWTLDNLPGHLFFNFLDLKPDDEGEDTISIHVNNNDAWACMEMKLTANIDNGCTEPETVDGDAQCPTPFPSPTAPGGIGELGDEVNFVFWADDGDNVLEDDELPVLAQGKAKDVLNSKFTLADSASSIFPEIVDGQPLEGLTNYYIAKAWCFGTLGLVPVAAGSGVNPTVASGITCDGTALNNKPQPEKLTADISFAPAQPRHNPDFLCEPQPSPTPIACIETYAATAHEVNQGTRKNGTAVLANRSVASAMFGIPQTTGTPSDAGFPAGSFYSLGFNIGSLEGGSVVLGFTNPFYPNPAGADLQVFEVTGGTYPDEKVKVEVGTTSAGPWTVVSAAAIRDEDIEIPAGSWQFVRLTDVSNIALFESTADAYDVDAVRALCGTPGD